MAVDKAAQKTKKKVARGSAKKVKDKWKAKQWYIIRSPKMYNGIPIAETLADEPEKLMGRIAEATLQDLSGDLSKMHVKLYFKVNAVKGTDCWTKFTGHELTSDYIRRLTRRKHSKVDVVVDVTTKDGWQVRVKPFAVTEKRAKSSQETEIRKITETIVGGAAANMDVGEFVRAMVSGEVAQEVFKQARVVYPLKRVEIRKSQVVKEPEAFVPDIDVFPEPVGRAEPEEAEADADLVEAVGEELEEGSAEPTEELVEEETAQ